MHLVAVGNLYYVPHASANVPSVAVMLRNWAEAFLMLNMLTYWMIVMAHHGLHYHRRYRDAELEAVGLALRAAQLESSMTEARLNALRMELNPHFLFNTLNAISGLVRAGDRERGGHAGDTGVGFSGAPRRDGVGLANTRARLEQLHGARATLITANDAAGGAVVTIRLAVEGSASVVAVEDVP